MKVGDRVTTINGYSGKIAEIEQIGNNVIITFEDRTRHLEKEIKIKKRSKK